MLHYLKEMICHTLVQMVLLEKQMTKITNNDDKYKEETSKLQDGDESVDNYETSDNLRDDSIIKTTKEEEVLIQQLMTMNFKYHVIQSVIDIVSLCGKKLLNWQNKIKYFQQKINGSYLLLFH